MWYNGSESSVSELYPLCALIIQLIGERSIFYYNPSNRDCNWSWCQQHNFTSQPQWVWHTQVPYFRLREQHNTEFFVLACLSEELYMAELGGLLESLSALRNVRVLIELASHKRVPDENSLALDILKYLYMRKLLNVALYFQHGTNPLQLYSYEVFPQFTLIQHRFTRMGLIGNEEDLFRNQLKHLKGYKLRVMHDYSEPNTILYTDASGNKQLTGFMWHFIETFAEHFGASIIPMHPTWPARRVLSEPYILELTRNGSADIGLVSLSFKNFLKRPQQYSYPVYYSNWCIMMPLELPLRRSVLFGHILEAKALALLIMSFLCFCLYRGIRLNQVPLWIRDCWRCWRLAPKLLALFLLSLCLAQLCHLLIRRPQQSHIKSFDDFLDSDLHIFFLRSEFDTLKDDFRAKYARVFRLTDNLDEFFRMRNSLNISWAYSITRIKYVVFKELQRHFQRPLFRYSDICLSGYFPDSLVLADDSIYREVLQLYALRVHQSGLFHHWLRFSLYDMVKAGKIKLKDYSTPIPMKPLNLQDFKLAWRLCCAGLVLALFVFCLELLQFYVNVCLNHL
ncbi:hypothetical protein ACLKA6_005615 [Drosophila palustris]